MKRLAVSFSGGRTSAYMTQRLLREVDRDETEVVVVFANTGEEDERTLEFVRRCDEELGFNSTWIEASVSPVKGIGTSFRKVDFETATRPNAVDGPFEQVVSKYGISNSAFPHCTRELKQAPIRAFLRSLDWKAGTYEMAIGIRADEADRVSARAKAEGLIYPLIGWGVKKPDVIAFWKSQSFDLRVPEHRGNCLWCWKKTLRKHLTLAAEDPSLFDTAKRLEANYAFAGPGQTGEPRRFFRGHLTVDDLVNMSRTTKFEPFTDPNYAFSEVLDVGGGCGDDSCEVFSDLAPDDTYELDWQDFAWAVLA